MEAGGCLILRRHLGAAVLVGRVDQDLAVQGPDRRHGVVEPIPGHREDHHLAELGRLRRRADARGVADLLRERFELLRVSPAQLHLVAALGELRRAVTADSAGTNDSNPHPGPPQLRVDNSSP
jgi:hypothetical protein